MSRKSTRREFMVQTAALGTAVWVSGKAAAASRSPNEKLNIASVGGGGKAWTDIRGCSTENIVAICDVDDLRAAKAFEKYPNVPKYKDYRKMLEERKDIDAVIVTVPDHNHAPASVMAMKLGKHVYCQKPLTHSIYEARRMREVAHEMNVATQMGNQGHAFDSSRRMVEIVRDGVIGHVREVHCWTDRPGHYWRQPVHRPPVRPVPGTLAWDLWLGPAPYRPFTGYKGVDDKKFTYYVPHDWRGWWDFGSGALGDMACHLVDTVYWALELGAPVSAEATAEGATAESAPAWQIIRYEFPERPSKSRGTLPPTTLTWYDGGKRPPKDLAEGLELGHVSALPRRGRNKTEKISTANGSHDDSPFPINGTLWIGDKGRIFTADEYSSAYVLYPREKFADYKGPARSLPRNPIAAGQRAPYVEWIAACKGGPMSLSNFEYASRLTEAMLVGVLSARLGKKIEWDAENMRAKNAPEAEPLIKREYRKGWTV